jgi:hypothetical protein
VSSLQNVSASTEVSSSTNLVTNTASSDSTNLNKSSTLTESSTTNNQQSSNIIQVGSSSTTNLSEFITSEKMNDVSTSMITESSPLSTDATKYSDAFTATQTGNDNFSEIYNQYSNTSLHLTSGSTYLITDTISTESSTTGNQLSSTIIPLGSFSTTQSSQISTGMEVMVTSQLASKDATGLNVTQSINAIFTSTIEIMTTTRSDALSNIPTTEMTASFETSNNTISTEPKTTNNSQQSAINLTGASIQFTELSNEIASTMDSTSPQTSQGYTDLNSVSNSYLNFSSEETLGSNSQYSTSNVSSINTVYITTFKTTSTEPNSTFITEQTQFINNSSENIANTSYIQKISSISTLTDPSLTTDHTTVVTSNNNESKANLSSSSSEMFPATNTFDQGILSSYYSTFISTSELWSGDMSTITTSESLVMNSSQPSQGFTSNNSDAISFSSNLITTADIHASSTTELATLSNILPINSITGIMQNTSMEKTEVGTKITASGYGEYNSLSPENATINDSNWSTTMNQNGTYSNELTYLVNNTSSDNSEVSVTRFYITTELSSLQETSVVSNNETKFSDPFTSTMSSGSFNETMSPSESTTFYLFTDTTATDHTLSPVSSVIESSTQKNTVSPVGN